MDWAGSWNWDCCQPSLHSAVTTLHFYQKKTRVLPVICWDSFPPPHFLCLGQLVLLLFWAGDFPLAGIIPQVLSAVIVNGTEHLMSFTAVDCHCWQLMTLWWNVIGSAYIELTGENYQTLPSWTSCRCGSSSVEQYGLTSYSTHYRSFQRRWHNDWLIFKPCASALWGKPAFVINC